MKEDEGALHLVEELFKTGKVVYEGYVDDPRNTDNAWLETTAEAFHCDRQLGSLLQLGDEGGRKVIWLDVNLAEAPRYANFYASHRQWVDRVAERLLTHSVSRTSEIDRAPKRVPVPTSKVDWRVPWPEYDGSMGSMRPVDFTHPVVLRLPPWVDPAPTPRESSLLPGAVSYEAPISFDGETSAPLNPRGRTGLRGRGLLSPCRGPAGGEGSAGGESYGA